MSSEDQPTIKRQKTAGEFILGRKLGSGGFGSVFEAHHKDSQLPYAVKRIALSVEDAERFRKEALYPARIAAKSLHVISVHSFFQDKEEDYFYLVTELIPNGDLRDFLERSPKPLPLKQALELAVGIARGLAAIHEQKVVHLDLKPRNILMDQKDGRWVPKIADFGLARSAGSRGLNQSASIGYAAPEQLDWDAKPGPESDLFSFGMILYELLTGRKATDAADRAEYGEWLRQRQMPPRPSVVRSELAKWHDLDVLTEELLEFDSELRKASASEVVRTLGRVLRDVERAAGVVVEKPKAPAESRLEPEPQPRQEPKRDPPPYRAPQPKPEPAAEAKPARTARSVWGLFIVTAVVGLIAWLAIRLNRADDPSSRVPKTLVYEVVTLPAHEERQWIVEATGARPQLKIELAGVHGDAISLHFMDKADFDNYNRKQDWSYYTLLSSGGTMAAVKDSFDSEWQQLPRAGTYAVLLTRKVSTEHEREPSTANLLVQMR